eukprot:jgi/Mesvir1/27357/Mv07168-RA.1
MDSPLKGRSAYATSPMMRNQSRAAPVSGLASGAKVASDKKLAVDAKVKRRDMRAMASVESGASEDVGLEWKKKNSRVWFKEKDDIWKNATIVSVDEKTCSLRTEDNMTIDVPESAIVPANPDMLDGVEDLTQLSFLNEPSVLNSLHQRYKDDEIYTRAGPVLIAVNPFRKLDLYGPDHSSIYRQRAHGDIVPPHVFHAADSAIRAMSTVGRSQSIIISGESGAGKTETAKIAMRYLASFVGTHSSSGIEEEILQTNPILEGFGNAKTLRNNNSSRFGKFIDIFFDPKTFKMVGANIETYLLEKSRVVHQAMGERSYHIFYQLCAGADASEREMFRLKDPDQFNFLKQSGCLSIEGIDDAEEFRILKKAMDTCEIRGDDQRELFKLVSAVLWLGELSFTPSANGETVTLDDNEALRNVAALLAVTPAALRTALTERKIKAGTETIQQQLKLDQALDGRDALAKAIYACLFDWLVGRINASLSSGKKKTAAVISILDIYGFESFQTNSFEQFCINYANERLQQHFNQHLFKLEQEEYTREGIDWAHVEFEDNQATLDLIEKRLGILSLLDEECMFPKGSDASFARKLAENLKGSTLFRMDVRNAGVFSIDHYAATVAYDTAGFLDKNKDLMHADLISLMVSSTSALLKQLGTELQAVSAPPASSSGPSGVGTPRKASASITSVGSKFKGQLQALMARLDATEPHYVRCIKPNNVLKPAVFDAPLIMHQLRCCGVLEVVRISRAGYPSRHTHKFFADRYGFLLPGDVQSRSPQAVCEEIIRFFRMPPRTWKMGATKLFLRAGQMGVIEDTRDRMLSSVVMIQAAYRGWSQRMKYLRLLDYTIYLQSLARGAAARRLYREMRKKVTAAITFQSAWRAWRDRHAYLRQRRKAVRIQAAYRSHLRSGSSKSRAAPAPPPEEDFDEEEEAVEEKKPVAPIKAPPPVLTKPQPGAATEASSRSGAAAGGFPGGVDPREHASVKELLAAKEKEIAALAGQLAAERAQRSELAARMRNLEEHMAAQLATMQRSLGVTKVFEDDREFVVEVKEGVSTADMDPEYELKNLKLRFDTWKKGFKKKLADTKLHMNGSLNCNSLRRHARSQGDVDSRDNKLACTRQDKPGHQPPCCLLASTISQVGVGHQWQHLTSWESDVIRSNAMGSWPQTRELTPKDGGDPFVESRIRASHKHGNGSTSDRAPPSLAVLNVQPMRAARNYFAVTAINATAS